MSERSITPTLTHENANLSNLAEECYRLLAEIPRGKVTTYGLLAEALGCKSPRAVGRVLHMNPYAPKIPCHRVVMSTGALGGYAGGAAKKRELLSGEGIVIKNDRVEPLQRFLFRF